MSIDNKPVAPLWVQTVCHKDIRKISDGHQKVINEREISDVPKEVYNGKNE